MANPQWLAGLPQYVEVTGYKAVVPDEFEETKTQAGPPRRDRKSRGGEAETIDCVIWCNAGERAILKAFFKTTLKGGTLAFDWVHPIDRTACTMEFQKGGLSEGLISSVWFQYQLRLRILP